MRSFCPRISCKLNRLLQILMQINAICTNRYFCSTATVLLVRTGALLQIITFTIPRFTAVSELSQSQMICN